MRAFSILGLILFFLFYCLITILSVKPIKTLVKDPRKLHLIYIFYTIYSISIAATIIVLYIYPLNARTATDYSIYLNFNLFLIGDVICKTILVLFTLFYYTFKVILCPKPSILYMPLILTIGIISTLLWSSTLGRKSLHINGITLPYQSLPASFDNFKIIQISDMHLGSFGKNHNTLNKVSSIINRYKPDILLFSGDLVNNFASETFDWDELFSGIDSQISMFAVMGNHDYGNYHQWPSDNEKEQNLKKITDAYERFGLRLLRNQSVTVKKGLDSIFIIGVDNWGFPPFPQYADLKKAIAGIPKEGFKILLSHDPAHWTNEVDRKEPIELTVSGHTHGAQWGLKFGGIEFSPIYLERNQWAGLYGRPEQYLYVSRGLGTIGLNFRLDMPSEVTIITLKKKAD